MPVSQTAIRIAVTLLAAAGGGLVGIRTKVPAGALVGAMVAVALLNVSTGEGRMPPWTKYVAQVLVGALIGLRIRPDIVADLKTLIVPSIILVVGMMIWAIVLGVVIHFVSDLDLVTALFGTSPGGLTDMSIIAQSAGADSPIVVILHLARLVAVVTLFPWVIRLVARVVERGGW